MHKTLLLLGFLLDGPLSGYDLDRILRRRGALYADLKKGNVYYLLDRLSKEGYLELKAEPGARGPRRERLIYSLTDRGRRRFDELLREVLQQPEHAYSGAGAAVTFLGQLPKDETLDLLGQRRESISRRRQEISDLIEKHRGMATVELAMQHLLSLIEADLSWTDHALTTVANFPSSEG